MREANLLKIQNIFILLNVLEKKKAIVALSCRSDIFDNSSGIKKFIPNLNLYICSMAGNASWLT